MLKRVVDWVSPYVFHWRPVYVALHAIKKTLPWGSRCLALLISGNEVPCKIFLQKMEYYFSGERVQVAALKGAKLRDLEAQLARHAPGIEWQVVSKMHSIFVLIKGGTVLIEEPRLGKLARILPNSFYVNHQSATFEGWEFVRAYNRFHRADLYSKNCFNGFLEGIHVKKPALLLGTGPSVELANRIDGDAFTVIICNTLIKDLDLCKRLNPNFLVFSDAIFHFGPSAYAKQFRSDLIEFARAFPDCKILVPSVYGLLLSEKVKGLNFYTIPLALDRGINVNLSKKFELHRFSNVLTLMMLPLGCTCSNTVFLLGFDGRAPKDQGFWSYASKTNYLDLLEEHKFYHPAFFRGVEVIKYARSTDDNIADIFAEGERAGIRFISLTRSHNKSIDDRVDLSSAASLLTE